MALELLMPALSPTMEEGTLVKWLVNEGDTVVSGDLLAEIETDKATMEFEAVDDGTIGKILIAEGSQGVKINTPIAILLEEGDQPHTAPVQAANPAAGVTPGAAPSAGAKPGAAPSSGAPVVTPVAAPVPEAAMVAKSGEPRVFASPLARRMAEQKGLDLLAVTGSGPRGRIVKADVEAARMPAEQSQHAAEGASSKAPAMATSAGSESVRKMYADRAYEEVTLDGMRKTIAARLTEAKQTIPHFYLRRTIKLDALLGLRAEINAGLAQSGVKLSINDFFIKASAKALQDVPGCNAVWAGDRILQMKASDVAVAVAIEGGLFTPVIQDAEKKSLSVISTEMKDLASRARERKLAPHEYQGGSFAISNLGMFGIENFDAVINPPHGSILAVGAGQKQPVLGEDGEMAAAVAVSVTLSVDHRVIDGALGARFLGAVHNYIEKPVSMLI